MIDAIGRFERVLADKSKPTDARAEALKFLVHFVGDIHQPLHCADRNGDKGGNGRLVFFLDQQKATNLHAVWDTSMMRTYIGRARIADYADMLDGGVTPAQREDWSTGTPAQWANESHNLARDHAYQGIPADGPPPKIDEAYVTANRAIVDKQLAKAGLRLAGVLNEAFASSIPATVTAATAEPPATAPAVDLRQIQEDRHERTALYVGVGVVLLVVVVNVVLAKRRVK